MRTTMRILAVEPPHRTRLISWRALRLYVRARRSATVVMAVAVALGVLFMVIHWR